MKIIHHERKRLESHLSIERLFTEIRGHMPADSEMISCRAPYSSKGGVRRALNLRHAAR